MTTVGEQARFVATAAIRQAVAGRETDVLDALGIDWRVGRPHITCPYPGHHDGDPSWRWDARKGRAYCTCIEGSDSALHVLMKCEGLDFETAKVRAAELIGRTDLIRENGQATKPQTRPVSCARPPIAATTACRSPTSPTASA